MKIYKRAMQILITITLLFAAFLGGICISEYRQKQEADKCTITTIAVVNADAGILVDGKRINYGEELIAFPDINFIMAGLEEAREGLDSNKYAAYILIPSTFSDSVNSINAKPEKAQITYEINPNLREDVQAKVADDIYNFLANLNTNISYVYVDAILQEFHSVQDNSNAIMANDISDMESINSINSEELIQDVEYNELETGTVEIQYLDLADEFTTIKDTSDNICSTYETDIQTAQDELLAIVNSTEGIDSALITVDDTLINVDILTNSEGTIIYQEGITHLEEYTEQFADNTVNKKKEAKQVLGWEEVDSSEVISPIEQLNGQIDEQIALLENLLQQEGEIVSASSTNNSQAEIQQVILNLNALKAELNTYYDNGIAAIDAIPDPTWVTEDMQTIINEEISQPIRTECDAEKQAVTDTVNTLQETIDTYATSITEFDATSYIEQEKIATDIASIQQIISGMQTEITTTDNSYIEYINELNSLTNQNIAALQESLDVAYQLTQANIDTTISGLKANRENLNAQNVKFLQDITLKLPYTRLGNLEYTQAYDFIVQPITRQNLSDGETIALQSETGRGEEILVYLTIGIIALTTTYWSVLSIHKKHQKSEGEEEDEWLTD